MSDENDKDTETNIDTDNELNIHDIILNLIVLNHVKKNDKINITNNQLYLSIDTFEYFHDFIPICIRRYLSNNNRYKSLERIELVFKIAEDYLNKNKSNIKEYPRNHDILRYMNYARKGINNLILTYENDRLMCNKLNDLLTKINTLENLYQD